MTKRKHWGKKTNGVVNERLIQPVWSKHDKQAATYNEPEFKPGKKTWTWFGKERLNWGVDWQKTAQNIIDGGYGIAELACEMELSHKNIEKILAGDTSLLNFKLGARLRRIEEDVHSEHGLS